MNDLKTAFHEIAEDYFQSMQLMSGKEAWRKTSDGLFHDVCSGKFFTKVDDEASYHLISPIAEWRKFSSNIQRMFDNKISFSRLNVVVNQTLSSLDEFPFSDAQILQHIDTLYTWANQQFHSAYIAFVPVYNLSLGEGINEISLANSVLHRGSEDSLMTRLSKNVHLEGFLTINPIVDFLAIPVSGDAEIIAPIVRVEANRSLACLRFISRWTQRIGSLNYIIENDASRVTLSPNESAQFLYYDPRIGDERVGMTNTFSRSLYHVNKDTFNYLKDVYELDNLNYHFQCDVNPVSSRIIRALDLYDSGVSADSRWQALYRYVVSINTAVFLTNGNHREIKLRLHTLIKFGGNYVGSIDELKESEDKPASRKWDELVGKIADLFDAFYILRGQILHGDVRDTTLEEVTKVRTLANNSVRLTAKLAREFNWVTKSDVDKWFKDPEYPPSIRDRANGIEPD